MREMISYWSQLAPTIPKETTVTEISIKQRSTNKNLMKTRSKNAASDLCQRVNFIKIKLLYTSTVECMQENGSQSLLAFG